MDFIRYLSDDDIDAVYNAAVRLGLAGAREVLLGSIPNNFGVTLKIAANPGAQLLSDLQQMNTIEYVEDAERTIPLQRWLATAFQLHRIRTEAKVLKSALDKIAPTRNAQPPVSPPPTPPLGGTWGPSLRGPQLGELRDALLRAFPDRKSLAQMVHVGIDLRLDEVAANSNLRNAVYDLLVHANAQGLIRQLFDAARIEAPGNPELLALVPKRGA